MPEQKQVTRNGNLGWRGWFAVITGTIGAAALLLGIGALGRIGGASTPVPSATASPLSNSTYGYWYCWDVGDPRPHHLGGFVGGDHLCTDTELQGATQPP